MDKFVCIQDKDINLSGEHVREGLTCVISVKVPNPEFEGQTKVLSTAIFTWNFIWFFHQKFSINVSTLQLFVSVILSRLLFLPLDKVREPRSTQIGWSICARVSYWILRVASRCAWFDTFQVVECPQGAVTLTLLENCYVLLIVVKCTDCGNSYQYLWARSFSDFPCVAFLI